MEKLGSLEEIFAVAKKMHAENKQLHEVQLEEEKVRMLEREREEQEKRQIPKQEANPEIENCSNELYQYIKTFHFVINAYEKHTIDFDKYGHPGNDLLETYYCSYGSWFFKVQHYADVDISEGIFSLTDIRHKQTREKVNFYCDLGCRNTSELKRDEVLEFLNYDSLDAYIQDQYGKYLRLPELLRKKGVEVIENDFSFGLNTSKGFLTVGKNVYVKVYAGWHGDFKVVVTNDNTWNVNSSNVYWGRKKAYYFDYHSVDDIEELVACIEAFQLEQAGKIGYFEEEEQRYYGNRDIHAFYAGLRDSEAYYKDAWNHYQIQIEHKEYWDHRGYNEENSKILNKYKGLEVFVETELTFNDAAQWSIGDSMNKSIIMFEYDRRKRNQCRLLIKNYAYDESFMCYDEETEDYRVDESKLVGVVEETGSFLELFGLLSEYVHTMIRIHEVEL